MVDFSQYHSPSALACSVVGDVDPVALFTPSISVLPVSSEHEVVSREGVSVPAVSLSRLSVSAVTNLVKVVLADSPVPKIDRGVVELVAVKVTNNPLVWARTQKSKSDDRMDLEGSSFTFVVVECEVGVPFVSDERSKSPPASAPPLHRDYFTCVTGSVVAEAGDRNKLACSDIHNYQHTDTQSELATDTKRGI